VPKSNSENSCKLNRREALLLSATAGVAALAAQPAARATARIQRHPRRRQRAAARRGPLLQIRSMERCAATSRMAS